MDAVGINTALNYTSTVSDADADETVLNAILGDTTGVVTASLAGAAVDLNSALANGAATDMLTLTLTGVPTDIADIYALNGKTSVDVGAGAVGTITSAGTTTIDLTATGIIWKSGINVTGTTGNDSITATGGNDTITGGAGNDTITGGEGADVITGGLGADTFVFTNKAAADSISDFTVAQGDVLSFDISALGLNAADFVAGAVTVVTVAQIEALAADGATNHIIVDTAAHIAAYTNAGTEFAGAALAIATDTGQVMYDTDANFETGTVVVGTVTAAQAAQILAGNLSLIA